jgi:hypothetical protein
MDDADERRSGAPTIAAEAMPPRWLGRTEAHAPSWVIETITSPFHCLYQDALEFHQQSHLKLARSEAEAARFARASLLLYLGAAEALVHQAAVELGRRELAMLAADPNRPLPLREVWRLLPAIIPGVPAGSGIDTESPPWPQFEELLDLRDSWLYPGPASRRRAYYRSPYKDGNYVPLEPHHLAATLPVAPEQLVYPRTGLPRDPYALRPKHLDTARGVLDGAVESLDRRTGGLLTEGARHRREPVRLVTPTGDRRDLHLG